MSSQTGEAALENLERQLLELEALECIFPDAFAHADTEALALARATLESVADGKDTAGVDRRGAPPLVGVVLLPGLRVTLSLDERYPGHAPPAVALASAAGAVGLALLQGLESDLNARAAEKVGEESLLYLVETARDEFADLLADLQAEETSEDARLAEMLAATEAADASAASADIPQRRFGRRCLYMHHIIATSKRSAVVRGALELGLGGVAKIGWPGVVVVEGDEAACQEYCRRLQRLRWKQCTVRGEETTDIPAGQTVDDLRRMPRGMLECGPNEMSRAAKVCRDAGLEDLFRTVMKIYR